MFFYFKDILQHFKFVNWRIGGLKNWRIRFLMSRTGYRSACKRTKKVNKQHLKFINRCNHLPQTHKKLLLKLFIDTKSYRQIYCLVHSSGCNKNVLKGVQIPCPGPILHTMKKREYAMGKILSEKSMLFSNTAFFV